MTKTILEKQIEKLQGKIENIHATLEDLGTTYKDIIDGDYTGVDIDDVDNANFEAGLLFGYKESIRQLKTFIEKDLEI